MATTPSTVETDVKADASKVTADARTELKTLEAKTYNFATVVIAAVVGLVLGGVIGHLIK